MSSDATTRLLLACGLVGAPLFVAVFLIDGATRPGYDPMYHPVSALSLGSRGVVQIINFILMGLIMLLLAVGLRRTLHSGRSSRWSPILIGLVGLGLLGAGIFVVDPVGGYPPGTAPPLQPSWHGVLHNLFSLVVFVALPAATFVIARRQAMRPGGRPWAVYDALTGIGVLVLFVAFAGAFQRDSDMGGALQRVTIVIGWLWIALLSLRLLREDAPVYSEVEGTGSRTGEER